MRTVLAVLAGLFTALAIYCCASRPIITFSTGNDQDVVVSCSSVVAAADSTKSLDSATSRSYTYRIEVGEEQLEEVEDRNNQLDYVGPWDVTDRIEGNCDRRRTGRAVGTAFSLAPAAALTVLAIALPAIRRNLWT